ncbi:MAG: hypothetical protein LBR35_02640, partial [Rickettsiales bacterium]|nr:hypothetical protein [Rickettsiales bacterium]
NNCASVIAQGKYIFYLNSDTILLNNAIKIFFDFWESYPNQERLGALGCNLKNEQHEYIRSGGVFPTYKNLVKKQSISIFRRLKKSVQRFLKIVSVQNVPDQDLSSPIWGNIDYITGADLFLLNNDNKIFDEDYFLYFEETDMEFKLAQKNLIRMLINGPEIIHRVGGSKGQHLFPVSNFSMVNSQRSAILFAKKNLNTNAGLLALLTYIEWLNPYVWPLVRQVKRIIQKQNKKFLF